jgi:outer membrane biosynthesis protein TonB
MKAAALFIAMAILSWAGTAPPEKPLLVLESAQLPMFPAIARTAHVTGEVVASFAVDHDGGVSSVEIESGPPVFLSGTKANIKTWRFSKPWPPEGKTWTDHTKFIYTISEEFPDHFSATFNTYREVVVLSGVGMIRTD